MKQYTIAGAEMQEGNTTGNNKKKQTTTYDWRQREDAKKAVERAAHGLEHDLVPMGDGMYCDTHTGEAVKALKDEKYPWREKKQKTIALASLYRQMHGDTYADRAMSCSTWLQYLADAAGDKRTLQAFNACHLRLCPLCSNRRSKLMTFRLMRILKAVKEEHKTARLLFLTLTVKNCKGGDLRDTLTLLTDAWTKLTKRRPFARAVKGWFRAIEITYNKADGTFHPHIHAILVVEPDYFNKKKNLYLLHSRNENTPADYDRPFWVDMWGECLKVGYKPSVRISKTKGKSGEQGNTDDASFHAALEAAKYATKDSEYLSDKIPADERAQVLRTYTDALYRKRLVALGGWMADAADGLDLEEDGDLVHGDEAGDDALTAETAEVLEIYGWHFKAGEHVLKDRIRNPRYKGGGNGKGYDDDQRTGTEDSGRQSLERDGGVQAGGTGRENKTGDKETGEPGTGHATNAGTAGKEPGGNATDSCGT